MSYIGFGIVHSQQPFTIDELTGDGTTTVFTLSTPKPIVSRAIIVTIDGVVQDPGALNSYDLDANGDLEFSEPPENLASIRALHLGRKYDLAVAMDGSVTPIKMAPDANGDFHFDTDTLYIDYLNDRVGINTSTPQHALDVVGDIHASGNITAGGNITLGDADTDSVTFNADITSHIIPDADNTYDLGSATKKWRALYVSGSTIHLGDVQLKDNAGNFRVVNNSNVLVDVEADNVTANSFTGPISGNVTGTVSDISNHNLDALGNVVFSVAPTNGQSIIWDNANSQWIAGDSFNQSDFDSAIALKSIGVLSDVDITTSAPSTNQSLIWDGSKFIPGDSFSQSDFDTAFTAKDTDALSEGTTNLYYTNERVDDRVANLIVDGVGISKNYDDAGNLLNIAIDFTEFDSDDIIEGSVNTYLASRTTDAIPEGTANLYYTDDRVNTFLASGSVTEFKSGLFKLENDFAEGDYVAGGYTNTFVATIGSGALSADRTINVPDLSGSILLDSSSIGDLSDVDITTTAPTNEQVLVWDNANSKFIPGDAAADFTDLTGQISAGQIPNDIITNAMMNHTVNVFSQEFTADGVNSTYTLTSDPGSKNALQVYVDGVPQRASGYTVVGTTLTLGGVPTNGQIVEIRGYGVALPVGTVADNSITGVKLQDGTIGSNKIASAAYASQTYTGDNTTTVYTMNNDPGIAQALLIMVDNVIQEPDENYTVSGTSLTFTGPPALNARIYIRYLGLPLGANIPADDSVTNVKLNLTYTSNQYTGDGSTVDYTIPAGHNANSLLLILDGSILPPSDYSVAGTTLTFVSPPLLNQSIDIRYMPV